MNPPSGVGSTLRDARERRGVSLRHVANATKISMTVLEALERNDISRLPGGIFSRAFVRAYALEVGLDPEKTVQDFIAQFPHESVTAGHPTSAPFDDDEAIESDRRMASTLVRLVALSLPLVVAVTYLGTVGRRPTTSTAEDQSGAVSVVRAESAAVVPVVAEAPTTAPSAAGASVAEPRADLLAVVLTATAACWISVSVDGGVPSERLLREGDRHELEARGEIVLKAGDAAALSVAINGEAAAPLGRPGQVVTLRLSLSNFRQYLAVR